MSTTQEKSASVKGGEFIIKESSAENTFIPEEFNEEHLMIQQTAHDFLKQEVQTCLDRIDAITGADAFIDGQIRTIRVIRCFCS